MAAATTALASVWIWVSSATHDKAVPPEGVARLCVAEEKAGLFVFLDEGADRLVRGTKQMFYVGR